MTLPAPMSNRRKTTYRYVCLCGNTFERPSRWPPEAAPCDACSGQARLGVAR